MSQQNTAQARARIESMKRQFEQKRQIDEALSGIKCKIGVYSGKGPVYICSRMVREQPFTAP